MECEESSADPTLMSAAQLFSAAEAEIAADESESPLLFLVALHERPTREVFDIAAAMLASGEQVKRALGARVLRELGPANTAGRRPFSTEAVPLLIDRLHQEIEPDVLKWIVSALGYNGAGEALRDVLSLVQHQDNRVRFHVAAALPSLVNPRRTESEAVEALARLSRDDDADTRFYALYALAEELRDINPQRLAEVISERLDDPDEQIRQLARAHQESR